MAVTRHRVRVALGALWILDGLLQLQRSMFTARFANQVLAPAGAGQPWFVSEPVALTTRLIAEHPVPWDAGFAAIQLALGIGFLVPRLVRPAIIASLAWAFGVWWLGEGLGGIAGGHADLLTGAPGAVLLYAVLAVVVWPLPGNDGRDDEPLPSALALAWAGFWVLGAVLRLMPGQASSAAIAGEISTSSAGAPGWLQQIDHAAAAAVAPAGVSLIVAWVLVCLAVGLGGLLDGVPRQAAATLGIIVASSFWVLGQAFGQPWTGAATDPNTSPLVVLMAIALLGVQTSTQAGGRHRRGAPAVVPARAPRAVPVGTSVVPAMDFTPASANVWSAPELWRARQPTAAANWASTAPTTSASDGAQRSDPKYVPSER